MIAQAENHLPASLLHCVLRKLCLRHGTGFSKSTATATKIDWAQIRPVSISQQPEPEYSARFLTNFELDRS